MLGDLLVGNQQSTRKCRDRATWMLSGSLIRVNRVEKAGDIPSPVIRASGNTSQEVGTIAVGKRAGLALLGADLPALDPAELAGVPVFGG